MNTTSAALASERDFGGVDKIQRYKWTIKDTPGKHVTLAKTLLVVDPSYQRDAETAAGNAKSLSMAQKWSWIACGAISVAKRADDDKFYVVDGQHRVLAARKRSDITHLPCMVFESEGALQEAEGFLRVNTMRNTLGAVDKYRAQLKTQDPIILFVDSLVQQAGRKVSKSSGPNTIACVSGLVRLAKTYRHELQHIWPTVVQLCKGEVLSEQLVTALTQIESQLPAGQSLTDNLLRKRLNRVGYKALIESGRKASAYFGNTGHKPWVMGIVDALNKGCQIRIALKDA